MMRIHLILITVLFPFLIYPQEVSNLREKYIPAKTDTFQIDTLSIIPNTISVTDADGGEIDSALYTIDYVNALLIWFGYAHHKWTDSLNPVELKITYRVFPYHFSKSYKHKDIKNIETGPSGVSNPFIYTYTQTKSDIFNTEGLNKSGSISRGISFGNNQDVIVNSNLDLRLSGRLSNNINILAAITDDNIPIQPEGNTQQIQDFDKVFIQLYDAHSKLIAGDFELERPESHFMNFYKKAQGVGFETTFLPEYLSGAANKLNNQPPGIPTATILHPGKMKINAGAAVSKGKYAKNAFTGTEGNQGPYKLKGSENESFIIILSGTEKVHIDGELLARGQENDYIIDYNTAEITFTPKRLITKDKRISIEFQYSEKNYTRSLLFAGGDFKKNKTNLRFNIYSEQDAKNQSLFQDLNSEDKELLSEIGDNLDSAIAPNIDSVEFVSDQVLYKKTDTVVNSILYKDVYVYSVNPDSAFYRLGFSAVVDEEGNPSGNYDLVLNATANGKVFKWVAPDSITGKKNGSYEPIVLLITPKKKQMATFGGDYSFSERTKVSFEIAGSNNDVNTFSDKDRNDDAGYALKFNFQNTSPLNNSAGNPWMFKSILSYEQTDRHFSPIERYRSVEFDRDWNLSGMAASENEYIPGLDLSLTKEKAGVINYRFTSFFKGTEYNAYKNSANLNLNKNNFRFLFDGSLLKTTTIINNTQFIRSKASFSRQFRLFTLGVTEEQERNSFRDILADTLQLNSFEFYEWGVFVNNADTAINKFTINYKQRTDLAPADNRFKKSTIGESVGLSLDMLKNPFSRFIANVTYRKLSVKDTAISANDEENSLLTRLEYRLKLLSGAITSGTFYEIGSGLEVKKEFLYLQVAAGQGVYTWNDYNDNGIKDLDEFVIAAFQDQADHIKVFIPTNDYIKTFTNLFNEVLYIEPSVVWKKKQGVRKFIARFANQTALRTDRKTTNKDLLSAYNPFLNETTDSNLVTLNSSFRNTLYFNRANPKFGIDLNYQDTRNKALLINDTTSRIKTVKGIHSRWSMSRKFTTDFIYNEGEQINTSRLFFTSNDYSISHYEIEPKLTYQPNVKFRIALFYNLINKENKPLKFLTDSLGDVTDTIGGGENSIHHKIGIELKHNVVSKGSLLFRVNFIDVSYNAPYNPGVSSNTSLAFEMLEGLQVGQNITWNLAYQRTLSKYMQLSITYDGRSAQGSNTIHTGGVQLRAFF